MWSGRTRVGREAKWEKARADTREPTVGGHAERRRQAFITPDFRAVHPLARRPASPAEAGRPQETVKTPTAVPTRTLRSRGHLCGRLRAVAPPTRGGARRARLSGSKGGVARPRTRSRGQHCWYQPTHHFRRRPIDVNRKLPLVRSTKELNFDDNESDSGKYKKTMNKTFFSAQSNKGEILNELGDIISDVAIFFAANIESHA